MTFPQCLPGAMSGFARCTNRIRWEVVAVMRLVAMTVLVAGLVSTGASAYPNNSDALRQQCQQQPRKARLAPKQHGGRRRGASGHAVTNPAGSSGRAAAKPCSR